MWLLYERRAIYTYRLSFVLKWIFEHKILFCTTTCSPIIRGYSRFSGSYDKVFFR